VEAPPFSYFHRDLPAGTYAVALDDTDSWKRIQLETRWSSLGLVRRRGGGRWSASCRACLSMNAAALVVGRARAASLLWHHWTTFHARAVRGDTRPKHTHDATPIGAHEVLPHLSGSVGAAGHGRRSLAANESPTLAELHEFDKRWCDQPDRERPFIELGTETLTAIHAELHGGSGG
jgi:hypothetical protein